MPIFFQNRYDYKERFIPVVFSRSTGWSYMFRLISLTPCQTAMFKFYTNLQNSRGIVTYPCHLQDVTNTPPVRIAVFLITIKYSI